MRLFIAIELPEIVKWHIADVRQTLARTIGPKWVPPQNWHVTLKFLGELDEARASDLSSRLMREPISEMGFEADRLLYFPTRGPVHVVAIGISGDVDRIGSLHQRIEDACEATGIARDGRRYEPHITIGRSKRGDREAAQRIALNESFPGPHFETGEIALVRSHLHPKGPRYEVLKRFGSNPNIS